MKKFPIGDDGSLQAPQSFEPTTALQVGCERHDELIDCLIRSVGPQHRSEGRRRKVVDFVRNVIVSGFLARKVEVCFAVFGSVPLKTYLPDGDIDIALFQSSGPPAQESWPEIVLSALRHLKDNPLPTSLTISSIEFIQAEVKLVKCIVDGIIVDISFNTFNGICTLAFLEDADRRIGLDHLFKRSVILVKGWCYYDSRLLGAHHGLLSTYALETMVLSVFNKHGRRLQTPLQVFHHFLEMFATFDFDKYCVSIRGPILKASLSQGKGFVAEQDGQQYMDVLFPLDSLRAFSPSYLTSSWQHKEFKDTSMAILDPLMDTNNLGKSIATLNAKRFLRAVQLTHPKVACIFQADTEEVQRIEILQEVLGRTWERSVFEPELVLGTLSSGQQVAAFEVHPYTIIPHMNGAVASAQIVPLHFASPLECSWDPTMSPLPNRDDLIPAFRRSCSESMLVFGHHPSDLSSGSESDDERSSSPPDTPEVADTASPPAQCGFAAASCAEEGSPSNGVGAASRPSPVWVAAPGDAALAVPHINVPWPVLPRQTVLLSPTGVPPAGSEFDFPGGIAAEGAPLTVPAFTHVEPFPGPADILAGDFPGFLKTLQEARDLAMRYQRELPIPFQKSRPPDLATRKVMRGFAPSVPSMAGFPGRDFVGALPGPQGQGHRRTAVSLDGSLSRGQHLPFRHPRESRSGAGMWTRSRQGELARSTTVRSDPFSRHASASGAMQRDPLHVGRTNTADAASGDYIFGENGAQGESHLRRHSQYPSANELLLYPSNGQVLSNDGRGHRQSQSSASDSLRTNLANGRYGAHPRVGTHVTGGGMERDALFQAPVDGLQSREPFHDHRSSNMAEGVQGKRYSKPNLAHDVQGRLTQRGPAASLDTAGMPRRQSPSELSELQDLSAWPALHSQSRPQRPAAQVPRWQATTSSEARGLKWGPKLGSAVVDLTEVPHEDTPAPAPLWPAHSEMQTTRGYESALAPLPWASSQLAGSGSPSDAAGEAGPSESTGKASLGEPDWSLDQEWLDPAGLRATSLRLRDGSRSHAPEAGHSRGHVNGNGVPETWTAASSSAPSTDGEEASVHHTMSSRTEAAVGIYGSTPPRVEAPGEKTPVEVALSSFQFPAQQLSSVGEPRPIHRQASFHLEDNDFPQLVAPTVPAPSYRVRHQPSVNRQRAAVPDVPPQS